MSISFGQWAKKVEAFAKKFSAGETYLLLRVPRKVIENNSISKRKDFFRHQTSSEKFSVFYRNFFDGPAKTAIHLSKGKIWEYYFPWKKYVLFYSFSENQSKTSGLMAKFFQWDFKESMLPIQKKTFWYFDHVFHGNVFASYCHWAGETFFNLWQKNFCRIVKTAPYVSRLPFGWLFEFSGKKTLFVNQFQKMFPDFYR